MPPSPKPGTNPFAIVSLVLAICGGSLLSIVFGIIALVQIRKSGQSGKGMAISGVVISGLWILVIVVGIVVAVLSEARHGPQGGISERGSVSMEYTQQGDCLMDVPETSVQRVDAVPCQEPHRAEVFAVVPLTVPRNASEYPGDGEVQRRAESTCSDLLDLYRSPTVDEASVTLSYFAPTRQSWASGDRTVICVAETPTRTGSIQR